MTAVRGILESAVDGGTVPGAVALVAGGGRVEVEAAGSAGLEGSDPLAHDSIFRIASMTKPVTAAAVLLLVDEGLLGLDDPLADRLPELASPVVLRTPGSPVDDVVPAARPITVRDVLESRAGWGFPSDFSLPAVGLLFERVHATMLEPQLTPPPDEWLAALATVPLLHQPGEAWLYNTCSDVQGVLVARVSGRPLPEFLAERIFEPLGMADTGFAVPAEKLDRFTSYYRPSPEGGLEPVDRPDGHWSAPPAFPSGAAGLVSTAGDWHRFGRMLLGEEPGVLSPGSLRLMTSDHLTPAQRQASEIFLEGQGWGYGGSVDVEERDRWNVPGRYGWVGGTGTAAHVSPGTGLVTVLLTQVGMTGPSPTPLMREFWSAAASG